MVAEYRYLEQNRTVITDYKGEPGVKLTYFASGQSGEAGDPYVGLDRGACPVLAGRRVIDQRWKKGSTDRERVKYGGACPGRAGNEASNRQWRENTVASSGQDEFHEGACPVLAGNGLYQVSDLARGDLNTNKTGISGTPDKEEAWNHDPSGNWHGDSTGYLVKESGSTTLDQNRGHNKANEIDSITRTTGASWPAADHDAAWNMTRTRKLRKC